MIYRPADASGDILPVLSSSGLLRGAEAAARLAEDRLSLYAGEWWENPSQGNEIIEMLRETRITERNADMLSTYLSSYIRETPGVTEVRDVSLRAEGGRLLYRCRAETEYGPAEVHYETE